MRDGPVFPDSWDELVAESSAGFDVFAVRVGEADGSH